MLLCAGSMSLFAQSLAPPPIDLDSLQHELARDSLISQKVDSPKGYVIGVPKSARLDSARSGWNPEKMFERRLYVLAGAGEMIFTVTVGKPEIPASATVTAAYTYLDHDTLTSAGTVWTRTYYLPTRSVRIELIPYGIAFAPYSEERERIFRSFRWKPGADSENVNVDPVRIQEIPERPPQSSFGG